MQREDQHGDQQHHRHHRAGHAAAGHEHRGKPRVARRQLLPADLKDPEYARLARMQDMLQREATRGEPVFPWRPMPATEQLKLRRVALEPSTGTRAFTDDGQWISPGLD